MDNSNIKDKVNFFVRDLWKQGRIIIPPATPFWATDLLLESPDKATTELDAVVYAITRYAHKTFKTYTPYLNLCDGGVLLLQRKPFVEPPGRILNHSGDVYYRCVNDRIENPESLVADTYEGRELFQHKDMGSNTTLIREEKRGFKEQGELFNIELSALKLLKQGERLEWNHPYLNKGSLTHTTYEYSPRSIFIEEGLLCTKVILKHPHHEDPDDLTYAGRCPTDFNGRVTLPFVEFADLATRGLCIETDLELLSRAFLKAFNSRIQRNTPF